MCGQKAFVVNRIGDFGFLLGIFLLFWSYLDAGVPTLEFREMAAHVDLLGKQAITLPSWLSFLPGFRRSPSTFGSPTRWRVRRPSRP